MQRAAFVPCALPRIASWLGARAPGPPSRAGPHVGGDSATRLAVLAAAARVQRRAPARIRLGAQGHVCIFFCVGRVPVAVLQG